MADVLSPEETKRRLAVDVKTMKDLVERGHLAPVTSDASPAFRAREVRWLARLLERCRSIVAIRERRTSEVRRRASSWPAQLRIDAMRLRRENDGAPLADALERAASILERALPKKR